MATPHAPEHDALLRRLSAELARLHSFDELTAYILGAVVPLLGGTRGSLCLLDDDGSELQVVAEHGYSVEVSAASSTFSVDAPLPPSEAVRTAEPVYITSPEDRDTRYPILREQPRVQDAAYAIEPLAVDGRVLGTLVIGFESAREFNADDRSLLSAAASRCAQALDKRRRP